MTASLPALESTDSLIRPCWMYSTSVAGSPCEKMTADRPYFAIVRETPAESRKVCRSNVGNAALIGGASRFLVGAVFFALGGLFIGFFTITSRRFRMDRQLADRRAHLVHLLLKLRHPFQLNGELAVDLFDLAFDS